LVKGQDWSAARVMAWGSLSAVFLGAFISRARRAKAPALDLSRFAAPSFRYANAATLVFSAAFSAMFLGSVLFLSNVWGYNTARAGLALTPGPLIVLVAAPLAGRLAARVGQRALLVPGGAIFGIGFFLRYLATSSTPHYVAEWLPAMVLAGIGVGLVLPSLASASAHSPPAHRFAVGSGVNQAVRQIGSVLGVSVVVALVGSARGADAVSHFFTLFLFLALAGLLTALLSVAIDTRPAAEASSSRVA
jgi:MFS family permease